MDFKTYVISSPHCTKVYYGATDQDLSERLRYHLCALRKKRHTNYELQQAFNANPRGWRVALISLHPTRQDSLDAEAKLIAADAARATNHYKNPLKPYPPHARIDEQMALDILMCKGGGQYTYQVAQMFGVSQPVVSHIWRGNHWTTPYAIEDLRHEMAQLVWAFKVKLYGEDAR